MACWPTSTKNTYEIRKFEGNPQPIPAARGSQLRQGACHPTTRPTTPSASCTRSSGSGERGEGQAGSASGGIEALSRRSRAKMRASLAKRGDDGIMYHVGRPGEDHYTNRDPHKVGAWMPTTATPTSAPPRRALATSCGAGPTAPSPDYANARAIVLISRPPRVGPLLQPPRPADHRSPESGREDHHARPAPLEYGGEVRSVDPVLAGQRGDDPARRRQPPHLERSLRQGVRGEVGQLERVRARHPQLREGPRGP